MHWKKVTLVGVGLLGGSLGMALKRRHLAGSVTGFVRRAASIAECRKRRAVDLATRDLEAAVSGAELIVLCTPLAQMRPLVEQMLPALEPGAIVTDVGSVKGSVVRELESLLASAGAHFIGSHPMAGSEKTGVSAARPDLFEQAVCVVTPTPRSHAPAVRAVARLWRAVGARVVRLDPDVHDELVSRSSHLPHLVAATLATFVLDPGLPKAQAALCANGFRDTTRIASGSPEMWRDIAVTNRRHLTRALDLYVRALRELRRLLGEGDPERILTCFAQARQRRDRWAASSRFTSPE